MTPIVIIPYSMVWLLTPVARLADEIDVVVFESGSCRSKFFSYLFSFCFFFFFQAEDGIRDTSVTGVQTCALPIWLLTAARKFDPDQGVKFISYAVWWIRQAILAALARQGRTVRVPLNRTADLSRIVRTAEYLRQTLRREPTPEEIADATKLSLEVVQSLAALNTGDVRLDAPLDPDGDRSLIERFIAEDLPDTEDQAMDRFLSDEIEQALNTLQRRDAKVLRLYFGLDGGREHTLEEIGGMLGVTRERVRQLRDRALKRLRDGEVGKALASFAA